MIDALLLEPLVHVESEVAVEPAQDLLLSNQHVLAIGVDELLETVHLLLCHLELDDVLQPDGVEVVGLVNFGILVPIVSEGRYTDALSIFCHLLEVCRTSPELVL